jgi:hypothetical protein
VDSTSYLPRARLRHVNGSSCPKLMMESPKKAPAAHRRFPSLLKSKESLPQIGWGALVPSAPPSELEYRIQKFRTRQSDITADNSGFGEKTRKMIVGQKSRLSEPRDDFCIAFREQ